jgi:hypothetical protein
MGLSASNSHAIPIILSCFLFSVSYYLSRIVSIDASPGPSLSCCFTVLFI